MHELLMQIIIEVTCVVLTICAAYGTRKGLAWLEEKRLLGTVRNAVEYAEQLCKANKITLEGRKDAALEFLMMKGIKIPEEVADKLIESVIGGINIGLGKTATTTTDTTS